MRMTFSTLMKGTATVAVCRLLYKHSTNIDMICNNKKTVCMVFRPKLRAKVVADIFLQFSLGTNLVQFVKEFKYLGHMITDNLTDDADIGPTARSS